MPHGNCPTYIRNSCQPRLSLLALNGIMASDDDGGHAIHLTYVCHTVANASCVAFLLSAPTAIADCEITTKECDSHLATNPI